MRSGTKQERETDGKIGFAPGYLAAFPHWNKKWAVKQVGFAMQKKSGCDILYKKMKSKNVSLAVEIYPREGTETKVRNRFRLIQRLKFIPVRGRKQERNAEINRPVRWNLSPWGDGNAESIQYAIAAVCWNLSPWGDGNVKSQKCGKLILLKFIPVRGRKPVKAIKI